MKIMASGPKVVFIDDHTEELSPLKDLVKERGASFSEVAFPEDVDNELLKNTDLVIVDYNLTDWIEHESVD